MMDHTAMREAFKDIVESYQVKLHMRKDMVKDMMRVAEKHAEYVRNVAEESDSLV